MSIRQKLSVTIITLNEAKHIREALESVKWADEIVIVDSFSRDRTVEICREYTPHVYHIPWQGFVEQKNIATEKTTYNWVLNIDADERVSPDLAEEIRQAGKMPELQHEACVPKGYFMPRKTFYLGDWIRHCGWYPEYKLRLFDKRAGKWVGKSLHEKVEVNGCTAYFKHDLYHYTYDDISHHVQTMNRYSSLAAARKTGSISGAGIFLRTILAFLKKYILKQGFRDGTRGIIVCLLSAFTVTLKYAKLWEQQHVILRNHETYETHETEKNEDGQDGPDRARRSKIHGSSEK